MSKEKEQNQGTPISRRSFLKGVGTGAVAASVAPNVLVGAETAAEAQMGDEITRAKIKLNINTKTYEVEVESRTTLLSVLRDSFDTSGKRVDLTGAKPICERGECGGCTVQADGKAVYSCMMLALDAQGKQITTVEGLANGDQVTPDPRGICPARCPDVWFLHTRFCRSCEIVFRSESESKPRGD